MGPSQIEIYNLATAHLGLKPVSIPTEQSVTALAFNRSWNTSRREALSSSPWPFATVIESLSVVAGYTPPSNWSYAYQYPTRSLRVWKLYAPQNVNGLYSYDADFPSRPLSIQSIPGEIFREIFVPSLSVKVILANFTDSIAEYSYDLEDTTLWDPTFCTLMGYRLAADTAIALTGDAKIALNLSALYNNALSEAKRLAAQENTSQQPGRSSTVDSRG